MDDRFKHQGFVEDRLVEECSELIKAIMKAKRFGWHSRWSIPDGETNLDAICREIDDVRRGMQEMQMYMLDLARKDRDRRELIAGRPIFTEPPQMSSSFAPPAHAKECQRIGADIHYMSEKIMGIVGARTRCGIIVASETPAWVNDDWGRVTCPECQKLRMVAEAG